MPYNKSLYTYPFGSVSMENLNIHLTLNISKIKLLIPTSLKPVHLVCNMHSYPFYFMAILSFQSINQKPIAEKEMETFKLQTRKVNQNVNACLHSIKRCVNPDI